MFVGAHERQLDPKGRLALPAPYRPRLEPRCYLSFGRDKCIDVMTAEEFEQIGREAVEKVKKGEMSRAEQRALAFNSVEVVIDAQGRINLSEEFRNYAGLTLNSRIVVAGSFDRVEIWDPARYERVALEGPEGDDPVEAVHELGAEELLDRAEVTIASAAHREAEVAVG
ncbi:MAG: division/cell wall cluster transcriptional repressor MraZ, partial [Ilumatobacteraceae bacterium]